MTSAEMYKEIMHLFDRKSPNWTCSEIADELEISESLAREVLRGLEVLSLIRKAPELKTTREMVYAKRGSRG